jgi:death on curing protein
MNFVLLSAELVEALLDDVLNPGELPGRARVKSLDAALARVEHRLAYGLIGDVFDLAAAYAMAVACGHCFNDANKRTAFRAMNAVLAFNGVARRWQAEEVGDLIVRLAEGRLGKGDLAEWLRRGA